MPETRAIETIDAALRCMDRNLDRAVSENDPRGYFTAVYRGVTRRVRDGILAGEFDDCERMERFDVRFARYWLDAYDGWDRRQPVPRSWECSFRAAETGGPVMLHVLLGINAHINLDLAVAAAQVCPGGQIAELRDDFERINDVLAELVDDMQDAVAAVSPVSGWLDRLGAGLDEAAVVFSLAQARSRAWGFAERLAASPRDRRLVDARDAAVAAVGARLVDPDGAFRPLFDLAAWRERQDVGAVVAALGSVGP